MKLCIDIGNTHIFCGIYNQNKLKIQFRYPSSSPFTSDQLGIFFKSVLRENDIKREQIEKIVICSVVPSLNYTIRSAFVKYFDKEPCFLKHSSTPILTYDTLNPDEIGADRISTAIAAVSQFPNKNLIIMDLGTATTFDAINAKNAYLGGVIIPGLYIAMKSLSENTAKLSAVHIVKPDRIVGKTTAENIQSGLYYSHLGAAREIIARMTETVFNNEKPMIIGTGGFAYLFEKEKLFDAICPELVLQGLLIAFQ